MHEVEPPNIGGLIRRGAGKGKELSPEEKAQRQYIQNRLEAVGAADQIGCAERVAEVAMDCSIALNRFRKRNAVDEFEDMLIRDSQAEFEDIRRRVLRRLYNGLGF